MSWRNDLLDALRVTHWTPSTVLVTLWTFWKNASIRERNLFEELRIEVAADPLGAGRSLPDQTDFVQSLLGYNDANFIREVAKLTRRLDVEIGRSIDTILRPVSYVTTSTGSRVWIIKRRRALPEKGPWVRQGVPIRALFRHLHLLPEKVADGIPLHVLDSAFIESPDQNLSTDTLSCHAMAYRTDCRYSVAVERPDASVEHERFSFPRLAEGAQERLDVALSLESSAGLESCSIALFPELAIDAHMATSIRKHYRNLSTREGRRDRAKLNLLCAGSFHRESTPRTHSNRAELIDLSDGRIILDHDKLRPFKATFLHPPKDEAIVLGDEVKILPTPVGLVAILICRDFVDETARIFTELDVDIVLVPSMGDSSTYNPMRRAAEEFCRCYGGIVICAMQSPPDADGTWRGPPKGELTTFVAFQDNEGRTVFEANPAGPVSVPF